VHLFDSTTLKRIHVGELGGLPVLALAFSADNARVASAGHGTNDNVSRALAQWSVATGQRELSNSMQQLLVAGLMEKSAPKRLFKSQPVIPRMSLSLDQDSTAHGVSTSADGRYLATTGYGMVRVWDVASG